jgi:uncharacterized protein YxeA
VSKKYKSLGNIIYIIFLIIIIVYGAFDCNRNNDDTFNNIYIKTDSFNINMQHIFSITDTNKINYDTTFYYNKNKS